MNRQMRTGKKQRKQQELEAVKRKNRMLLNESRNQPDVKELLSYRKDFYKRSKDFLRLCISLKNWADKRSDEAKALPPEAAEFVRHLDELKILAEDFLDEFDVFTPKQGSRVNFDEHEVADGAKFSDSGDLFVDETINSGYKLGGKVIRKAKITAVQKGVKNETRN